MKKLKRNYVAILLEDMVRNKVQKEIIELPLEIGYKKNGVAQITYKMVFDGHAIEKTANTKAEAKRQCYKFIFQNDMHLPDNEAADTQNTEGVLPRVGIY